MVCVMGLWITVLYQKIQTGYQQFAQLLKLEHVYQMDLDLYDYNIDPFKSFCKNRSGGNPEPPGLWDKLPMIKSEVLKVVGLPGW